MKKNIEEYLLENLFDGVYYVDKDRIITYWNKSAERITGYSRKEVVGKSCSDAVLQHIDADGRELCKTGCPLYDTIGDGRVRTEDLFLHHKDGHRVPVSVRVSPVRDDAGYITGAVEIFNEKSDPSENLAYLEKIKKQTFIDPVTRVGNRKYAQVNLNNRYAEMKLHSVLFGILFADIDYLKKVKDRHGERVANRILEMSAKSIKSCLKSIDTVGRWDEERFIVIIPNIQELSELNRFAESIRKFIENSWLHIGDTMIRVTASVGGSLSRKGDSLSSLLERAEKLTDKARQSGGNQCNIA